nr:hypothetical protein [Tanacetum cinerariifolium]
MGTFRETLAEGIEGAFHLGLEQPRVCSDLSLKEKERESQLYDDFEHFHQNKGETIHAYYVWFAKLINDMQNIKMPMSRMQLNSMFVNNMLLEWGRFVTAVKLNRGATSYEGAQNKVRNANPSQARQIKCYNCNGMGHIALNCTKPKRPQNSKNFKDKMLLMQAQENGVALDEEQLLFIADDDCDAFDYDVNKAPTAQTMFMANILFVDPIYDEASLSYDLDIISKVPDHENYQDANCEHHENKVAIGYKNPLYLTRTQQVQPALYNGHESIKTNHVSAIVHNSENTQEIVKITRKKMNDKMKDPECVNKKVKITPHDYSKENYLATFTPQKQLTHEQIFWSKDLLKVKAEALKEQITTLRPIKVLTV